VDFEPSPTRGRGRPRKVPATFVLKLRRLLDDLADEGRSPVRGDLTAFVRKHARLDGLDIAPSTIGRIVSELDTVHRKPDYTTLKRAAAEKDPRNYVSLAGSLAALREIGVSDDPRYIFNFDATVMQTKSDNDNVVGGIVVTREYAHDHKVVRPTDASKRVGVKVFVGGNAAGQALKAVTIVHDGNSSKEPRMVQCDASPGNGMLLVTPERGNDMVGPMVVRHFINEVQRYVEQYPPPEDQSVVIYYDGAAENISCAEDPEVLAICKESNIILAKLPASMTHKMQPMDVSNVFRGSKQRHGWKVREERYEQRFLADLYKHLAKGVDDALGEAQAALRGEPRRTVIEAVVRARMTMAQGLTEPVMAAGFEKACMYPFQPDLLLAPVMNQFPEWRPDPAELAERTADIMREKGIVTETDLDELGVPKTKEQLDVEANPTRKNPEDRALRSQRCVHLNHEGYLSYAREKKAAAAAAKAEKEAAVQRRKAEKEAAAQRKRAREAAAADENARQEVYDAEERAPSGDHCVLCGAARDLAEKHGFSSKTGPSKWFNCRNCAAVLCPRCHRRMGTTIAKLHRERCPGVAKAVPKKRGTVRKNPGGARASQAAKRPRP
jgi:hypothetical protein